MSDELFARLKQDHDDHRAILDEMAETSGETERRKELLEKFTKDVKSHAAAEEQALYSTMLRKPPTTDDTRHSVAEHHELNEALNDLAATDMSSRRRTLLKAICDQSARVRVRRAAPEPFLSPTRSLAALLPRSRERERAERRARSRIDVTRGTRGPPVQIRTLPPRPPRPR